MDEPELQASPIPALPSSLPATEPLPSIVVGLPESPHRIPSSIIPGPLVFYSDELAQSITDRYIEGLSLSAICREPGMPSYSTLLRWLKTREDFKKMMDASREIRAYHMEEAALEAASSPNDKDEVPAARLEYDSLIWAASVHNPERYGKKTTLSGDAKRPVVFQVSTGVPEARPAIEASQEKIIEAEFVEREEGNGSACADESDPSDCP